VSPKWRCNVTGLTVFSGGRFVEKWLALLKDVAQSSQGAAG
jgi:hypothetical protein